MPESDDQRQEEHLRLEIEAPGLSAWQRYCPQEAWRDPILDRIERYLDQPASRALFDQHEASEAYPSGILQHLQELGLSDILVPQSGASRCTAYHMCGLNAVSARADTSVAVTLSVNVLGLLPAYLAASPEQVEAISQRIRDGNFSSLMLSELPHGSNIVRNEARALRGVLRNGAFVAVDEDQPCTHYRLSGEKHLINGATRHGLIFACLRTRHFDAHDRQSEVLEPMTARGDFTMFWLDRGPGMTPLPRYHTLPARAADISGLRFDDCIVEADRVIGREHGGLAIIHKTLMLSRGGVAALASGCLSRARDLAMAYAQRRNIYGRGIVHLGAISDHLMQMEALTMMVAAISLKATSLLNAAGLAAAHYTSVAKLMACHLAEEGVREGQRVLGARSLLTELPYERLIRDVNLYGIFDGTSHVMLEELASRLAREARSATRAVGVSTLDEVRACYLTTAQPLVDVLRTHRRPILSPLIEHLESLDELGGEMSLAPLVRTAEALLALVRGLQESGRWKADQGTRLATAELYATLEVLVAGVELCDPDRRAALGLPPPAQADDAWDRPFYDFAITWLGSRVAASVRQLLLRSGLEEAPLRQQLAKLDEAERQLVCGQDEIRSSCRQALLERPDHG